ncbi:MAG TPA: type VII secretion-associated serine protease mycosin [Streptosporangiaceae bacterium]|nr:type VII secretion-associated serine protease mycosin [Streptosporangiaceae bacterium]
MPKLIPTLVAAALSAAAASAVLAAPAAAMAAPATVSARHHHGSSGSPRGDQPSSQCLAASNRRYRAVPWAQRQLAAARVWSLTQGAGQLVAVVDSGVSGTAAGLAGAVLPGRDILTGGSGDSDCLGHGTFTAGLIAARPTPGTGLVGVAPQARILPVDVVNPAEDESSDPVTSSSAVAAGISYAVKAGASVIDVSTAATPGPSLALSQAIAYAEARNVVVVAPVSTSDGTNPANVVSYPAAYPGVIAVAAVDSSGAPLNAAGRNARVDLAAPGDGLTSIGPRGPGDISGNGAALATAFVAGTAALVRSYYPNLSAAQVGQRLELTADQPGTALPNPEVGYGIVDPYTALTTVLPQESGGQAPAVPPAPAIHLPPQVPPDTWPLTAALIVCGLVLGGLLTGGIVVHITRHGRRNGWRSSFSPRSPGG